jgi:DNA invertase Pin-like site-specific DNA recombinase/peptidoglycan hydrolase-like protein with peptidoglycan-binding domain
MERKFSRPGVRAGLAALTVLLVLLAGTGTCVASGAGEPVRLAKLAKTALLERGAGYDGSTVQQRRVRVLQRALRRHRAAPGPVDGYFGPLTEAAVLRFQTASGVAVDGVVGPHTWKALAPAKRGGRTRNAVDQRKRGSQQVRDLRSRAGFGPAAVGIDPSDPLSLRTSAFSSPTSGEESTPASVGLSSALLIAAAAALIAALCEALIVLVKARRSNAPSSTTGNEGVQEVMPIAEVQQQHHEDIGIGAGSPPEPVRAIGYASVPKAKGEDQASLEIQAQRIQILCDRRGWELLHMVRDVENGHPKGLERPGLLYALERIDEGEASCLVVSQLERLSRSAADLGRIVEWIDERDARLIAIDLRLDTGSAQGRLTARVLSEVGEWEGRRIADQTRKGLAAARASRAKAGRPAVEDMPLLKEQIVTMRHEGMTLQAIADRLNAEGVPTLRGGTEWRPSSVQAAAGYRRPKGRRSHINGSAKEGRA